MPALPPLSALRAFDAAARHLNMRLAAEELGVSHGAVAQQVRSLEANLGTMLFERVPHGLSLTEAGLALYPQTRRAFALLVEAVAAARPSARGANRAVTVSVTPSFAARWLIPRLSDFAAVAPDIDVRVLASERREPLGRANLPDLAVRMARLPVAASLEATLLLPIEFFPVCSPSIAAEIRSVADLCRATLLHDAHALWPLWLELADAPKSHAAVRQFSHSSLALDAAVGGQGIAMAPSPLVAGDLARSQLVAPFGPDLRFPSDQSFYVVSPRGVQLGRAALIFRDWLFDQATTRSYEDARAGARRRPEPAVGLPSARRDQTIKPSPV